MRFGRCYGLACGHHTPKEFTDIPLEEFGDITIDNQIYWKNLISHYHYFIKKVPGVDMEYCPKCNDNKVVMRIHAFAELIDMDSAGIKT